MIYNLIFLISSVLLACTGQKAQVTDSSEMVSAPDSAKIDKIVTGAEQVNSYLPLLKGKRVAMVVNQTSTIGDTHLVDSLLSLNVNIVKILSPEHGFRGEAANGELVKSSIDQKTNLPLVSLYGKNRKPTPEQLSDVDVVIFDVQDVGARFYTYISTMHYLMEACAENNKQLIIFDRPNPHGMYVDGPIMQPQYKSFIGMHPIPIVHGLTVGELALMINGEKWLKNGVQCKVEIVKNKNYQHSDKYLLPIKPSPNLPNNQSISLYPSICLFEGTTLSLGRGTTYPFQVVGGPDPAYGSFTFTPVNIPGMTINPPLENKLCYGIDLRNVEPKYEFTLKYLIDFYNKSPKKDSFFIPFFEKLVGTKTLREQIIKGMTEEEIKATWKKELDEYRAMRKKYLLYGE
ncbi:MAG TPA: DUF1343 domain-containing protein [Cytophagales bacterium]|nr:DUF1343 domain-containing protein [Cytophagales bacterium]